MSGRNLLLGDKWLYKSIRVCVLSYALFLFDSIFLNLNLWRHFNSTYTVRVGVLSNLSSYFLAILFAFLECSSLIEGCIFLLTDLKLDKAFFNSPKHNITRGSTLPKLCTRFPKSWGFWKPHMGFLGFPRILKVSWGFPGILEDSKDS